MRIAVVDGQGGGVGKSLIERLRAEFQKQVVLFALGTNSLATSGMLRAGADEGATGENAIVYNAARVDLIIGSIGILAANAMLGELTPAMARAIAESPAQKLLIPINRCGIHVAGTENKPLPFYMEEICAFVRILLGEKPAV